MNDDVNGLRFISTIESKTRPYYGVQFHPEKNLFEFKANKAQPHTFEAIQVAQYFANFFINQGIYLHIVYLANIGLLIYQKIKMND